MNDQDIVRALQTGGEQGYSALMDNYMGYVVRILTGIAQSRLSAQDLEELAADIFFRIWKRRELLKGETLKAYVAQTARNAAVDHLRRRHVEFLPYEDDVLGASAGAGADQLTELQEQKEILKQSVESFGEPDREIFVRFYYYGETLPCIARRLQINSSTAKTKLHRARARIREQLKKRGYGCE